MRKISKALAFLLTAVLMLSSITLPAYARESSVTVSDLTKYSVIYQTGAAASAAYTKSGDFTMRISGADLYRDISIPASVSDISDFGYLEFWVYSANSVKSVLTLSVISDNPDTACRDYYAADFTVSKQGWQLISLSYGKDNSVFTSVGKPLGWDKINSLCIWPYYGGKQPASGASIYFDKIEAFAESQNTDPEPSDPGEDAGYGEGANDLMIYDWSKKENVSEAKGTFSTDHSLSGDGTRLCDASNPFPTYLPQIPTTDWSGYDYLQMTVYSDAPTGQTLSFFVGSENPATDGVDGYNLKQPIVWQGWKTVTFELKPTSTWRTPLGWDMITSFESWSDRFPGGTKLYFDRIWLTNSPIDDIGASSIDNSTDYIVPGKDGPDQKRDSISLLKKNYPSGQHPRLILTCDDFENLKRYVEEVPFVESAYSNVLATATNILGSPITGYSKSDGLRLDRVDCSRLIPLALAYKINGDVRYKDRLWEELESICTYTDWNPIHDIDVGDYARPVALVYDWLYNDWTDSQRRVIRNGMMRNAILPFIENLRSRSGFAGSPENHNLVTNSGLGMAALAMGDEPGYEYICNEVINATADSMQLALQNFAPDGACVEGVSYWEYGQAATYLYESALISALGTDFGMKDMDGLDKTGEYVVAMHGCSDRSFNYSDASELSYISPSLLWLSRLYNDPGLASYRISKANVSQPGYYDLLYYRDGMGSESSGFNRDFSFGGLMSVGSMRSSYTSNSGMYLGFKGGSQVTHSDLDRGSFVMEALGERWIIDLGSENYSLPGLFSYDSAAGRWTYYKKRAEGHNTIVINPADDKGTRHADQNVDANSQIEEFRSSDSYAYGIVDLTDAYTPYVTQARRGFAMVNNRSAVIVQDEIKTSKPIEVYSFFHTSAAIEISKDKKSAELTLNGKKMKATLASPSNAVFEDMKAESLLEKYKNTGTKVSDSIRKLAVHLKDASNPTISVVFEPIYDGQTESTLPKLLPLDSWAAYGSFSTALTSLSVGGIPVDGFSPDNTNYVVDSDADTVSATAPEGIEISYVQPTQESNSAYVTARSNDTAITYSITFEPKERIYKTDTTSETYEIKSAESENIPQAENPPEATVDGNFATRWSADGEVSAIWDLGEVRDLNKINLAFMNGDQRSTIFDIDVSEDKENWVNVYSGQSSGKTSSYESFMFALTRGRYIKFRGHGNTSNEWNSISEVSVPVANIIDFDDTKGHWAEDNISYMANEGFVNGIGDKLFMPDSTVTYAEGIAMAERILGFSPESSAAGAWYESYIKTAETKKLIPDLWYSDGRLDPNKPMTRADMCMLLVKAYESKNAGKTIPHYGITDKFTDLISVSADEKNAIDACLSLRLAKGASDTVFAPENSVTRAEAAVFLERLYLKIYA